MIFFYTIIVICTFWGASFRSEEQSRSQYLSKESTNAIKGLCILLVFLRRGNQYIAASGYDYLCIWDKSFALIDSLLGQLIVVMFLFFSGYGVMCSIKKKGDDYLRNIPKHRALNTLLNFDIAVIFFIILAFLMGEDLTKVQIFMSLICWEEVGNSNWYIFVIIICYLATWLSFSLIKKLFAHYNTVYAVITNFIILLIISMLLFKAGKSRCWYDTIFVYPIGMMYGVFKEQIDFCSRYISIKDCR